jgi:hypothetical protein
MNKRITMMYKKYLLMFLFLFSFIPLFSQVNILKKINTNPKLEIGYLYLYNNLNSDNYFKLKYSNATDNGNANIGGLDIKLSLPTNHDNFDFSVGALIMKGLDEIDLGHINPNSVNAHDYNINGGGVYLGISPKLEGKYIGLTSNFSIGIFSFKEYVSIVNNIKEPFVNEHDMKASYGLGAISSVGISFSFGNFGINPSLTTIFSGGAGASFTFYGIYFPIFYQF